MSLLVTPFYATLKGVASGRSRSSVDGNVPAHRYGLLPADESARGLAQSKTLRNVTALALARQRFGLRQFSGALELAIDTLQAHGT